MVGLDHLVHTKKEKHSAILQPFPEGHFLQSAVQPGEQLNKMQKVGQSTDTS